VSGQFAGFGTVRFRTKPKLTAAGVAGGLVFAALAVKLGGLPNRLLEVALIGAVLIPVALAAPVRRRFRGLDRFRQTLLGGMVALALLGQLTLNTRSFPFIAWNMYASSTPVVGGTVPAYEFDAVLRSGRRVALVPGRYLAPESSDRMSEALRRQVERLKPTGRDPRAAPARAEHAAALSAIARLYDEEHRADPVASVLVLERRVSVSSGDESAPRVLWRVATR
jgi:hypothetical protein